MLKRALLVLLSVSAIIAGMAAVPAQADGPDNNFRCSQAYYNSGDTKQIVICAEWDKDNNGPVYWAKAFTQSCCHGPTNDPPYAVRFTNVILWSTNIGSWCEGKYSACDGTGNGSGVLFSPAGSDHVASDHYGDNTHECLIHAEVDYKIYWSQNHFDNNNPDVTVSYGSGLNSGESGNLQPHCAPN